MGGGAVLVHLEEDNRQRKGSRPAWRPGLPALRLSPPHCRRRHTLIRVYCTPTACGLGTGAAVNMTGPVPFSCRASLNKHPQGNVTSTPPNSTVRCYERLWICSDRVSVKATTKLRCNEIQTELVVLGSCHAALITLKSL